MRQLHPTAGRVQPDAQTERNCFRALRRDGAAAQRGQASCCTSWDSVAAPAVAVLVPPGTRPVRRGHSVTRCVVFERPRDSPWRLLLLSYWPAVPGCALALQGRGPVQSSGIWNGKGQNALQSRIEGKTKPHFSSQTYSLRWEPTAVPTSNTVAVAPRATGHLKWGTAVEDMHSTLLQFN